MLAYQLTNNFNEILAECQSLLGLPPLERYKPTRPTKPELVPGMAINAFYRKKDGAMAWSLYWGRRSRQHHYLDQTSLCCSEFSNPRWLPALNERRCLIPMDGFFTWPSGMNLRVLQAIQRTKHEPQPVRETRVLWSNKDRYRMVAGIWGQSWFYQRVKGGRGQWLKNECCLPLVNANGMPLTVPKNLWAEWLLKTELDFDKFQLAFNEEWFEALEFCPL